MINTTKQVALGTALKLMALALVVGAISYAGIEMIVRKKVVTHQENVANQHNVGASIHQGSAEIHDANVDSLRVPLLRAQADIAAAKKTVAQLEQDLVDERAKPGPPDLSMELSAMNSLLAGLRSENSKLYAQDDIRSKQVAELSASRDEWKATSADREAEARALRIALSASKGMQKDWAAGAVYMASRDGRDGWGVSIDRDFKAIRAGLVVLRTEFPSAKPDLGLMVKVSMRF